MARTTANTDAQEPYQSIPLPLYFPYNGILANGPTSWMSNMIITTYKNNLTGKLDIEVQPRGGYGIAATFSDTSSDTFARGIFYWDKVDKIYFVFGDKLNIASSFSALYTSLLTNYTGGSIYNYAHFTEYFDGTTYFLATKKTNPTSKAYIIDTTGSGTGITQITDADYPSTTAVGQFINVDGYLFVMTNLGQIYNSDLGAPLSWTSTNFIVASISPDRGIGLAKYKNQIVAFGANSVEFFYNAANPTGSPLARTEQAAITGIGCINAKTIVSMQDSVYWISGDVAPGVYKLDNFKPKKISTQYIDDIIASWSGGGPDLLYAGKFMLKGKEHYYFAAASLSTSQTLLYDSELDIWFYWTTVNNTTVRQFGTPEASILPTTYYPGSSANFFPTIGDNTTQKIGYFFGNGPAADAGDAIVAATTFYPISFELKTRPLDFNTHNYVRIHRILFRIKDNTGITLEYKLNNLGRFRSPYLTISQSTGLGDLKIAVNAGTAKTIATTINTPVIISGEIQYSICEH